MASQGDIRDRLHRDSIARKPAKSRYYGNCHQRTNVDERISHSQGQSTATNWPAMIILLSAIHSVDLVSIETDGNVRQFAEHCLRATLQRSHE